MTFELYRCKFFSRGNNVLRIAFSFHLEFYGCRSPALNLNDITITVQPDPDALEIEKAGKKKKMTTMTMVAMVVMIVMMTVMIVMVGTINDVDDDDEGNVNCNKSS